MALVQARLPMEFEVAGDHDAWPLVATALLSRAASTLRHVGDASRGGQDADAATLARSLYEHVVHLGWLAASPTSERLEEWRKHDFNQRLVADADARRCGETLLNDAERAALEAQVETMQGNRLVLEQLAIAADKHWAGTLPGMRTHRETRSFKGLYALVYRKYSGTAHPGFIGLNPVIEDITATRKRVVLEKPTDTPTGPLGMANVVYALGLYVAAETLGWPDADAVSAAFGASRVA